VDIPSLLFGVLNLILEHKKHSKLADTNSNNNNHNWPPNLSKERFLGRNDGFLRDLLREPPSRTLI